MDERGDGRSIENPPQPSDLDREEDPPVEGETSDDAGREGEGVSRPGEGLVTEEGVNERKSGSP